MKTLFIDKKKFVDWYFDDETVNNLGCDLVDQLIKNGIVEQSLCNVLNNVGYIPVSIVVNKKDIVTSDRLNGEIEELSQYKIKFK
jgi:hypothetical protein